MSDPANYTVGWICAIPTEAVAARQFLEEEHDPPSHVSQHDNNVYTLGRIAQHRVVIAVLPKGEYGTTSAASVARDMLHSFPNVRIGLMVGIGGGAPSKKYDVRLGDVVVSSPQDGWGGVLQYDYGKAIQGKGFQHSGFLNQPQPLLRAAVGDLEGRYLADGNQIHENIHAILDIKKRMKRSFQRPELSTDRLYLSTFIHTDSTRSCDEICNGDEGFEVDQSERLVKRDTRSDDEDSPTVHYGLIASANTLMKNAQIRDSFAETHGVLCFEMEAAGLMNHFPCLVIRGICDYSDSHKNKDWQGYAAMAAAAYTKDLLGRIPPTRIEAEKTLSDILSTMNEGFDEIRSTTRKINVVTESHKAHHQDKLNIWLSPPDPSTNYNKALLQRHEGSGQWFLAREAYSEWKTERNSFLWLHGIPGCGKTVLSSTIIEDLQKNAACLPLYFYFDFNDTSKQSLENAVRSLVAQLYGKRKDVQRQVDSLYSSCENGRRQPSIDSLCKAFQDMIQQAGEVWVILDALDECPKRKEHSTEGLLHWIESIQSSQEMNVHLLVTSRREEDIKSAIETWSRTENIIAIQSDLVKEDIRAYVRKEIRQNLRTWKDRPGIQKEIEDTLTGKADGMFRWVSCQLDALKGCHDPLSLRDILASLPTTLEETYARILGNIPSGYRNHTRRILQFLIYSTRPLWIEEVVDAIAVDMKGEPQFDENNRAPCPEKVASYCSSLIVLTIPNSQSGGTRKQLQLAHFSVKEYLMSSRLREDKVNDIKDIAKDLDKSVASASIANVCLAYLLELDHNLAVKVIRQSFFLAQYSARYWTDHALVAESHSESDHTLASRLFLRESSYTTWCRLYDPERPWDEEPDEHRNLAPALYCASLVGSISAVKALLDKGADVSDQGGYFGNALQAASQGGYEKVVQMLLDKGADANAQGGYFGNALQVASQRGHEKVVKMLLDKGADVSDQGGLYGNALQAASQGGYERMVQMLLDKGADVNAQGGEYGNALQAASQGGHEKVVQMLRRKETETSVGIASGAIVAKQAAKRSVSPASISGDNDERAAKKSKTA